MKIKLVLIILITLASPIVLRAQSQELSNDEIAKHIGNCLIKNYHPDSVALAMCCRTGAVFIKFKINPSGEITDLAFSKGSSVIIPASLKSKEDDNKDTPAFIIDAVRKAVGALRLDTTLINTLRKSNRVIIQPFIYVNFAGCRFPKITASSTVEERTNFYPTYVQAMTDMDKLMPSIMSLLNFTDGKLLALDGLLLSPISVGSGGVE